MPFDGWVWPVQALNGAFPWISDPFRRSGPPRVHLGVDIMFHRSAEGSRKHPEMTPLFLCPSDVVTVLSSGPGTIFRIDLKDPHGISVTIDHHNVPGVGPRVTVYRHLRRVNVEQGQLVAAGQPIGIVGHDLSGGGPNHLHFELWDTSRPQAFGKTRESFAIDPDPDMRAWIVRHASIPGVFERVVGTGPGARVGVAWPGKAGRIPGDPGAAGPRVAGRDNLPGGGTTAGEIIADLVVSGDLKV